MIEFIYYIYFCTSYLVTALVNYLPQNQYLDIGLILLESDISQVKLYLLHDPFQTSQTCLWPMTDPQALIQARGLDS